MEAAREDPAFLDEIERLLPTVREPYAPDKPIRVECSEVFEQVARLCERYRGATGAQRSYVRSRADRTIAGNLEVFGLRAAILGARQRSLDLVRSYARRHPDLQTLSSMGWYEVETPEGAGFTTIRPKPVPLA